MSHQDLLCVCVFSEMFHVNDNFVNSDRHEKNIIFDRLILPGVFCLGCLDACEQFWFSTSDSTRPLLIMSSFPEIFSQYEAVLLGSVRLVLADQRAAWIPPTNSPLCQICVALLCRVWMQDKHTFCNKRC